MKVQEQGQKLYIRIYLCKNIPEPVDLGLAFRDNISVVILDCIRKQFFRKKLEILVKNRLRFCSEAEMRPCFKNIVLPGLDYSELPAKFNETGSRSSPYLSFPRSDPRPRAGPSERICCLFFP